MSLSLANHKTPFSPINTHWLILSVRCFIWTLLRTLRALITYNRNISAILRCLVFFCLEYPLVGNSIIKFHLRHPTVFVISYLGLIKHYFTEKWSLHPGITELRLLHPGGSDRKQREPIGSGVKFLTLIKYMTQIRQHQREHLKRMKSMQRCCLVATRSSSIG